MKLTLAFDVYGTLIDTAGVVVKLDELVGDRAAEFAQLWRDKQLEYSFRRALMRRYRVFAVCVAESLDQTAARFGVALTDASRRELLDAFAGLPPFDDARDCLTALDPERFDCYALSNGSAEAVEALLDAAGLGDRIVDVVSVDEIGTFKPDPAVYSHFLERVGAPAERSWLVSGNAFDVSGAVSAGMRAVWVDRSGSRLFDGFEFGPSATVTTLAALESALTERR